MQHYRDLELFVHLSQTLHFGRTSSECHVSKATLSRAVQRLEAQAGERLLDRGPRGVTPTAAGRRFASYANQALDLWHRHVDASAEPAGELVGEIQIFATVTACQLLLPPLLTSLRRDHPRVRLNLRTGDAGAALARLDEGDVDIAVAPLPNHLPHALISRPLTISELVVVVSRDQARDPEDWPFVVPRRGLVREAAERWWRSRSHRPVIAAEPDSHEALLTLVALGYGAGIVPRIVVEASTLASQLRIATENLAPYPVGLCVRREDLRRDLIAQIWTTDHTGNHRKPQGEF